MKKIQVILFLWLGAYGHIVIYLKQKLFQNQTVDTAPLDYLTNPKFIIPAFLLLSISMSSWVLDALLRQRFRLSEMTAYGTLLKLPMGLVANLFILWLSERTLSDKVNWNSVLIWVFGMFIAMWGARGMVK